MTHDEAGIGVNGYNCELPGCGPLLDPALGLLALAQSNFDFAKLDLYFLAGFRIRSNGGAQVAFNDR